MVTLVQARCDIKHIIFFIETLKHYEWGRIDDYFFSQQGTLRYNLDPFSRYDDEALWSALEKAHLKEKIVSTNQDPSGSGDTSITTQSYSYSLLIS